jgi:KDO2-lipid IV(A) lauroyltransferase
LIIKARTNGGCSFIFKDKGAKEMLRTLRSQGALGTLYDQAAMGERESAPLTFMGLQAFTNLGPFKLAEKTGAIMIPIFSRREGNTHVFEMRKPIIPSEEPREGFTLTIAQKFNDMLEEYVKNYPDQWLWSHRRWKTPSGLKIDPLSF